MIVAFSVLMLLVGWQRSSCFESPKVFFHGVLTHKGHGSIGKLNTSQLFVCAQCKENQVAVFLVTCRRCEWSGILCFSTVGTRGILYD